MLSLSLLARKSKTFFFGVSIKDKLLFLQAFILSGIARVAILCIPFKTLKKYMGTPRTESPKEVDIESYRYAKKLMWVISQVGRYTPWESKCLVKALVVQRLLKKKGIRTTIYLGVNKDDKNNMLAHAWLRCGKLIVTGAYEKANYVEVAKFSN